RQTKFTAGRQYGFAKQLAGDTALVWELESVSQRNGHIQRTHAFVPVGEEAADFVNGFSRRALVHCVAFASQLLPVLGPTPKDAVQPDDGMELGMILAATHPNGTLFRVE